MQLFLNKTTTTPGLLSLPRGHQHKQAAKPRLKAENKGKNTKSKRNPFPSPVVQQLRIPGGSWQGQVSFLFASSFLFISLLSPMLESCSGDEGGVGKQLLYILFSLSCSLSPPTCSGDMSPTGRGSSRSVGHLCRGQAVVTGTLTHCPLCPQGSMSAWPPPTTSPVTAFPHRH